MRRVRARLVIALVLLLLPRTPPPASAQQLSPDVVPDQYELRFVLDFQNETFSGSEQILVSVNKPATRITLNAAGITFREVTIVSGWSSQPATVTVDERQQTATFTVKRRLAAGPARIRIEYSAKFQATPRGLYAGRANGRRYASTQFEATDARRAFPCFDQPDMKASFLVSAVVPAGDAVISNARVLSDTPGPETNQHTVKFATTVKMSTYLMALAVGDFDCLAAKSDAIPIRVCAIRNKTPLGQFALDAVQSFLRFYDGYFETKYPFGKLDLVAIPDFIGGGMENTGAIFFGEHELLLDPARASIDAQKTVATTIAHELAHQWFGDLVTMTWWNDLWLKEGFATFMENRPLQAWKPEWHAELDEVASAEEGMDADALPSTHPARTRVTTPAEIDESYDAIVYQKAGAVLRMTEAAMGPDVFRAAINAFVKKFAYSTATAEEFWATMAEHNVRPIDRILQTFLEQPGVPVVSVAARCVTDATSALTLTQQRFWVDKKRTPTTTLWAIPVSTRPVAAAPGVPTLETSHLLTEKEQTFDQAGCNALLVGNAEASGYFRVSYAPEVLARLAKEAETRMTPAERLRLLDDQWDFARAGQLQIGEYLSLVAGYATERRSQIVERLGSTLRDVDDELAGDATREAFHEWVRRLFTPLQQAASSDNDVAARDLHAKVLYVLGEVGRDPGVLARAAEVVNNGDGDNTADPQLLDVLMPLAAANGSAATLDRLVAVVEHPPSEQAQSTALRALGSFKERGLVARALDYALSRLNDEDALVVVGTALKNRDARSVAWPFVKAHWKELIARTGTSRTMETLLESGARFCDAGLRDDFRKFLEARGASGSRQLQRTLDRIQACIDFKAAQQGNFERWIGTLK